MIKLSFVIITRNEEKNIERCLKSVQPLADEIVVVDSFSTDKTQSICEQYNVKFVQHPFENYSAQKNYANSLTTNDFIFSIDADEVLSEELQKSITAFKQNPTAEVCTLNRLTNYAGTWIKHGGWYPDTKIRLWNKNKGQWQGAIHEHIHFSEKPVVFHLQGDLLHYTYNSFKEHIDISYKYADMMAKEMLEKGKRAGFVNLFLSPVFKFFKIYFLKQGFRDGYFGLMIAATHSYSTLWKYILLRFYSANKPKN